MKRLVWEGVIVLLVIAILRTETPLRVPDTDSGDLFNLVNEYRKVNGLKKMVWWPSLCDYAEKRAREIVTDFNHEGFRRDAKKTRWGVYVDICPECVYAGENLAKDYPSNEAILESWLKSKKHKKILDTPEWNIGCVAIVDDNNYVAFEFAKQTKIMTAVKQLRKIFLNRTMAKPEIR